MEEPWRASAPSDVGGYIEAKSDFLLAILRDIECMNRKEP